VACDCQPVIGPDAIKGAVLTGCAFSLQALVCSPTFFQNAYAVRFSRTARAEGRLPAAWTEGLGFSERPAIEKGQGSTRSGTGGHPQSDRPPSFAARVFQPRKHSFPRQSTPAPAPRPDGDRHRASCPMACVAWPAGELSEGERPISFGKAANRNGGRGRAASVRLRMLARLIQTRTRRLSISL
jgi:hypothetical protein